MAARNELLADAHWLRARYLDDGLPVTEIAELAGAEVATVHRWLQLHGVEKRSHDIDRARVERLHAKGWSAAEIGREMEVDRAVILDRLLRWGLTRPASSEADREQLRQWYQVRGWSIERIAEKLEVSKRTVTRRLLAAGIELRGPGRKVQS